jgi:FkbM family methyltransferase
LLNENVKANGLQKIIVSYPVGLGEKNDVKSFSVLKSNPSSINIKQSESSESNEFIGQIKRLDDIKIRNVSLIKLDVSGYELEVLEGGKQTIKANRPVILMKILEKDRKQYTDWIIKNFDFYKMESVGDDYYLLTNYK